MTKPGCVRLPARRLAALLAVAALLVVALPVRGATSVDIEVRPLLGGRYQAGGWAAIAVTLVNDGAPSDGFVIADTPDGTVRTRVDMPAGARKGLTLYLRPQAFAREVQVRYEAAEGSVTATAELRAFERASNQAAIVGDGAGNLRPQLIGDSETVPEPIGLAPVDLPDRPEPLAGLAAIVWAADSTVLSQAQRHSLERWVASGGQLIVVGGADWQARTAAFADLLPVSSIASADAADLAGLAAWTGAAPPTTTGTIAGGELRDGAAQLVGTSDGGPPLLSVISRGAGRVGYLAVDVATAEYRTWEGAPRLWSRLLPNTRWLEDFFGTGPTPEDVANSMSQALGNLPSLEVPPVELLLAVIIGYIVLIGPISYLVLRRLDRRELAWVTAPLLVVVFSACSYGIGATMKGGDIILNQLSVIRTTPGASAASVQTYAGLFSPSRDTYDLTVEADALLSPLNAPIFDQSTTQRPTYLTEQGDPAHLRGLSVGVFGFQAVRADAVVDYAPTIEVEWRVADGKLTGEVTNAGDEPLEDVAVISSSGGRMIGALAAGASEAFELNLANFNGSSASDQVYGFGGVDPSSAEQRQKLMRRGVIDSLVGYGGWFPGREAAVGLGLDRGPFVIGWRAGEGPAPVLVDGKSVQRYAQAVEVVSGRPALGPGEVTIGPAQLAVEVVSTDGEVSTSTPGYVTMGNGEATFALTLPLEAATLEPTRVELIFGPDPGMVVSDPGAFGGWLPAGYTAFYRDARTGDWVELGALNQRSSFEVDDAVAVVSDAGRIELRVVAEGIDPSFGQSGVFASASITGVVGQ
jgi:hypothetical protein